MRRRILAITSIAVLITAAAAVADSIGTKAIKPVTATFSAANVLKQSTRSCTAVGGTISATTLELGGTSQSADAALNGPLRVHLKSVVDTGKGVGTVEGTLRVDVANARDTTARIDGVYSNGKLHGLLRGSAAKPFQRLLGNVSADLSMSGLANGKIGATDANGGALLAQPGKCEPAAAQRVVATGNVSSLTESSITVAGITCVMDGNQRHKIGTAIRVGDRVEMACRLDDGKLMLEKLARA